MRAAAELPFYISSLDETDRLSKAGCEFCYPEMRRGWAGCSCEACFDMGLAQKLSAQGVAPVTNDFRLNEDESIVVITGPNQSEKTTFVHMLGQLFYLGALGLKGPDKAAAIRHIYPLLSP